MTERRNPTSSPANRRGAARGQRRLQRWLKPSIVIVSLTILIVALSFIGSGSRSIAASAPESASQQEMWGDVDCSGSINPIDSLKLLRKDAGLSSLSPQGLCPGLGSSVAVNAVERLWGDGDCSGALNPVDSLKTLRYDAGLSAPKVDPACPGFGDLVTVGAAGGLTLLNEVLFTPGAGEDPFVELKATGSGANPSGLLLVNERDDRFVVPNVGEIAGEDVLLLELGGSDFLDDESGFVELRDGQEVLDRVAWGEEFVDSVNLGSGVLSRPVPEGVTIGRPPGSNTAEDRLGWIVYYEGGSPGLTNPHAGGAVLLPIDGARFLPGEVHLNWQPTAGASGYRVRVFGAADPTSAILDETVASPGLTTEGLSVGEYVWNLQVIGAAGAAGPVSSDQSFEIVESLLGTAPASVQERLLDVELISARQAKRCLAQ